MEVMTRHRSHSAAFKRQVAEEFIAGETLHALSKRHDLSRQLIRIWVGKFEAGALDEDVQTGGFGPVIHGSMNSMESNSLATFATLGDLMAGCATRVQPDACARLYEAATPPGGPAPTDTL